jgi:hypothetical protein
MAARPSTRSAPMRTLAVVALLAASCTKHASNSESRVPSSFSASPTLSSSVTSSASESASASPSGDASQTILVIPDLGSVSWVCRDTADPLVPAFSTTFRQANVATETVSYSVGGVAAPVRTLQPGESRSTPFTKAGTTPLTPTASTHNLTIIWHVLMIQEPFNTKATITITLGPAYTFGCFNPSVSFSRVRLSHAT